MGNDDIPLKIENLTKCYGELCAVDNVSFSVKPGEVFGLLGPNGAGKTSIISCITTIEEPTSGNVSIFGRDVAIKPKEAKIFTGNVPQEIINHGFFNIVEILIIHSGYYGLLKNRERIDFLIQRLGLWEHRHKKVKQLSGGMKRRLLIAKALVHSPKLLLLDEPTAGVDIELRASLWEFVRELKDEGISILLTTHYLQEAEEMCDRVGILQSGVLKEIGNTQELIQKLTHREVSIHLNAEAQIINNPYLVNQKSNRLDFRIPSQLGIGELIDAVKLDVRLIKDLKIQEGSLEDAFRQVLNDTEGKKIGEPNGH